MHRINCPNPDCGKLLAYADHQVGKTVRCRTCQQCFRLPAADNIAVAPSAGAVAVARRSKVADRAEPAWATALPVTAAAVCAPVANYQERLRNFRKAMIAIGVFWIIVGLLRAVVPGIEASILGIDEYMFHITKGFIHRTSQSSASPAYLVLFLITIVSAVCLIVCGLMACLGLRIAIYLAAVATMPQLCCSISYADSISRGQPNFITLLLATLLPFGALIGAIILARESFVLARERPRDPDLGGERPPATPQEIRRQQNQLRTERARAVRRSLVVFGVGALLLGLTLLFLAGYGLDHHIKEGPIAVAAALGFVWLVVGGCLLAGQRWAVYLGLAYGIVNQLIFLALFLAGANGQTGTSDSLSKIIGGFGFVAVQLLATSAALRVLSKMKKARTLA
jgi:hypothetical protein